MSLKKSRKEQEEQARKRAELIVQVLSGRMKASEAARRLGVSRKTYYKWEKRFLSATMDAVSEKEAGRPMKEVDEEKEQLQQRVSELEKQVQVLRHTVRIRDLLHPKEPVRRGRPPKKRRKRRSQRQSELELGSRNGGMSGYSSGGDRGAGPSILGDVPEKPRLEAGPASVPESDSCSRAPERTTGKKMRRQ